MTATNLRNQSRVEPYLPILFVALLIAARFAFPNKMTFFIEVAIFSIYVMGNNVLMGYLGYTSFGQPFYLSCGAYTGAIYFAYFGSSPLMALLLSIATGLAISLILGPSFIRLRGNYFTLVNAALAAIGVFMFERLLIDITNGNDGLWYRSNMAATPLLDIRLPKNFFFFVMLMLLIILYLYRQMDRSSVGAVFKATKIADRKMQFLGYSTFRIRWTGFAIATVMSTFAGALFSINFGFVNPNLGENSRAIEVLVATLIGGVGSVYGPLFGALGFLGIKDIVSNFIARWELVVGIITLFVLFRFQQGIWGFLEDIGRWITARTQKSSPKGASEGGG